MKASIFAALAVGAAVVSAAPLEGRNNDGKKKTSAGGTGPNPSVPGDGGNGLTVSVIDPMGNNTIDKPVYRAISDFDYSSFNLGLYQEWIELDLFNYGLQRFSVEEFEEAGMTQSYRDFLQFMANQETGHAQLLTNILGPGAAPQCTYNYSGAFDDVRSYLEFNVKLTRFGESGVWGFLSKLNSRPAGTLLSQSIATEARQQMAFRQFLGAPGMDVYFEPGIPQAWQWTLLAPYIQSCPPETPRIAWSNYASLSVDNNPSLIREGSKSAVSTNISRLVSSGDKIEFSWTPAGEKIGPNNSYTTVSPGGSTPKYALWTHQLNATYSPLTLTSDTTGYAYLPGGDVYDTDIAKTGPAINGTGFVVLTNDNPFLTPYNLTLILPHMVAGPAVFVAG